MRHLVNIVLVVFLCSVTPAYGKSSHYQVVVADPFLELHTGPGRGYPVFHVVDRGERVDVVRRRTDWFQVQTAKGVRGWARGDAIARTLDTSGEPVQIGDPTAESYLGRRWEAGLLLGDFEGADALSVYGGYHLTRNISVELRVADLSGDFSDGWMITAGIVHQPFPEWRLSPYATLGTGIIRIEPQATLVQTEDRTDQVAQVGVGVRAYLTRRFMFRAEYSSYLVFTSRNENEDVDEWKAGFAFFF